jgi:hypothetical protein
MVERFYSGGGTCSTGETKLRGGEGMGHPDPAGCVTVESRQTVHGRRDGWWAAARARAGSGLRRSKWRCNLVGRWWGQSIPPLSPEHTRIGYADCFSSTYTCTIGGCTKMHAYRIFLTMQIHAPLVLR